MASTARTGNPLGKHFMKILPGNEARWTCKADLQRPIGMTTTMAMHLKKHLTSTRPTNKICEGQGCNQTKHATIGGRNLQA